MSDDGRASARSLFAGHDDALAILERVLALIDALGPVELRVGRSQIAFRWRRGFAYLWRPAQHLGHGAPAVLSIAVIGVLWQFIFEPRSGLPGDPEYSPLAVRPAG